MDLSSGGTAGSDSRDIAEGKEDASHVVGGITAASPARSPVP